jgi:hypothetical protein
LAFSSSSFSEVKVDSDADGTGGEKREGDVDVRGMEPARKESKVVDVKTASEGGFFNAARGRVERVAKRRAAGDGEEWQIKGLTRCTFLSAPSN